MRPLHLASLAFLAGLLRLAVADNASIRRPAAAQGERQLAGAKIDAPKNATTGETEENAEFSAQVVTDVAEFKIVGGTLAAAGEYPFYAHVANTNLCGGSLIHEDIVLTAAHCSGTWFGNAIIGSIQIQGQDGAEMVAIQSEHPHPQFVKDTTEEFDIMIVKLASPSSAPVIQLNQNVDAPIDGTPVTVMGFGTTSEGGAVSTDMLKVDVTAYAFGVCEANLGVQLFPATQICAGDIAGGRDSCQGDSGMCERFSLVQEGPEFVGVLCLPIAFAFAP
jgi:trypsin